MQSHICIWIQTTCVTVILLLIDYLVGVNKINDNIKLWLLTLQMQVNTLYQM